MELDFEAKDITQTLDMFSEPLSLSWGDALYREIFICFIFTPFNPNVSGQILIWANFSF